MKNIIVLFTFLVCASASSQIQFEQGYFITNSGERVDCLIKNSDWMLNPVEFDYKFNENGSVKTAGINAIKTFKVNEFYFIKETVQVESSSDHTNSLSTARGPNFETKTVFLRLLVDGKVDLLEYVSRNKSNFFYRLENGIIEPLIYKRFQVNHKINKNSRYRQQLVTEFECDNMSTDVEDVEYKRSDLKNYFRDLNKCLNSDYTIYQNTDKKSKFLIQPLVGIGYANLDVDRGLIADGTSLSGLEYSIGVEFEHVFSFNKYKWSAVAEVAYRTFKDEQRIDKSYGADLRVNYNSILNFIGARHYFYTNQNSKFFFEGGANFDLSVGTEILFANAGRALDPVLNDLDPSFGFRVGAGYALGNKLRLGINYNNRSISGEKFVEENYNINWKSNYSSLRLSVSYNIF